MNLRCKAYEFIIKETVSSDRNLGIRFPESRYHQKRNSGTVAPERRFRIARNTHFHLMMPTGTAGFSIHMLYQIPAFIT